MIRRITLNPKPSPVARTVIYTLFESYKFKKKRKKEKKGPFDGYDPGDRHQSPLPPPPLRYSWLSLSLFLIVCIVQYPRSTLQCSY